jgi:hypothetical protein
LIEKKQICKQTSPISEKMIIEIKNEFIKQNLMERVEYDTKTAIVNCFYKDKLILKAKLTGFKINRIIQNIEIDIDIAKMEVDGLWKIKEEISLAEMKTKTKLLSLFEKEEDDFLRGGGFLCLSVKNRKNKSKFEEDLSQLFGNAEDLSNFGLGNLTCVLLIKNNSMIASISDEIKDFEYHFNYRKKQVPPNVKFFAYIFNEVENFSILLNGPKDNTYLLYQLLEFCLDSNLKLPDKITAHQTYIDFIKSKISNKL